MMRALFLLPLLALAAWAQGVDSKIDYALKPDTPSAERIELFKEVVATKEGAARLAQRALKPEFDAGVVHAAVGALFDKDEHLAHLEPICRLLLYDAHRAGTLRHFQRKGEEAATAAPLVAGLADIALGRDPAASSDPKLRLAGIIALGAVPRRAALEVIVQAWLKDGENPDVTAACREVLASVLPTRSAREADAYLRRNPYLTYFDLLKEHLRKLQHEIEWLRKYKKRALEQATATEAFASLADKDVETRRFASQRIAALAESGKTPGMTPTEFATATFDTFVAERDSDVRDSDTLAHLCGALEILWKAGPEGALQKARNAEKVAEAVLPLARAGAAMESAGGACVALLTALGQDGRGPLVEFAREFKSGSVRRLAISALGKLAARGGAEYIGHQLAAMLDRGEQDPGVLTQLLFTLSASFDRVTEAEPAVAKLLEGKIAERDAKYCVVILRKVRTDTARQTLMKVAASHAQVELRRVAVEEGLIPLARHNGSAGEILGLLAKLVLSGDQPAELRLAILKALGASGLRDARQVLASTAANEQLDESYRKAAADALLALAAALVTPPEGGVPARADFDAALEILKAEVDRKSDPERLGKLARVIVAAGDTAKIPVRGARYWIAELHRRQAPADKAAYLQLLTEAADKAPADGPRPEVEEPALRELVALLATGGQFAGAVVRSERLAAIAKDNPAKRQAYLLDAADYAVRAGDKAKVANLVARLRKDGDLEGQAATRLADIEKRAAALG